jgi:beta-amylase
MNRYPLLLLLLLLLFLLVSIVIHCAAKPLAHNSGSKNTYNSDSYVPVFVMMPLDTVDMNGKLNNVDKLSTQLKLLKSVGVDGIMVDVWWGIVQREAYDQYDFEAYNQLFQMCRNIGLKIQANMAFHQCGTNVGDQCFVPLPKWVLDVAHTEPDIFYKDKHGHRDAEYLTLGVDNIALFPPENKKRTALQLYTDFMQQFYNSFKNFIGSQNSIVSIEIGLGPAGELRYPSYQLQNNIWRFPGIGEFQCYDRFMLADLNQSAYQSGHPHWGKAGPNNAGDYNSQPPQNVPFFSDGYDNWNSDYGKFFLSWYSNHLIAHGERILSKATSIFVDSASYADKPAIAAKIAGIHWWYNSFSHAAENTAGYYNTYFHDGYEDIAAMLKKYNVQFAFTCLEMEDHTQTGCGCSPEQLVKQTREAAWKSGIKYSGENALPIYDNRDTYHQIIAQSKVDGKTIESFTYLRLDDKLFQKNAWQLFSNFVKQMHNL